MKNYIISKDNTGIISNYMLADLRNYERVYLMHTKRIDRIPYTVLKRIMDVQLQSGLKKISGLCGNILMTNEVLELIDIELLNKLKANGSRITLLLIDPLSGEYPTVACAKKAIEHFKFDKIYTFDPNDSKEYGYEYTNCLYSVIEKPDGRAIRNDLYYRGNLKGRERQIERLIQLSELNEAKSEIKVFGYNTDSIVPYEKVVDELQNANCILDITQKCQSGITLRYYEAVVYNRKLLTNNTAIVNLPYYDEKYMKIYKSFDEIDWNWVKQSEEIDYNYDGRFSPVNIF